jgi:hypothetical protein
MSKKNKIKNIHVDIFDFLEMIWCESSQTKQLTGVTLP